MIIICIILAFIIGAFYGAEGFLAFLIGCGLAALTS